MTFYMLQGPDDYLSHRDEIRRNGWGGFTVAMPGVDCSACGDTRGLPGRVLPWRLPRALEQELLKLDGRPIPEDRHKALRQRIEAGLREVNPNAPPMPPGAGFPPLFWNFKEPPHEGCFWWGLDLAVSARIAEALRDMSATGFDLIPVDQVRVGMPIPRSLKGWGTGGDGSKGSAGPEVFWVSVYAHASLNSRMRQLPPCPGCGYAKIEWGFRAERWEDAVWNGEDIFNFASGGGFLVTERVATMLHELAGDSVVLTPLQEGKAAFRPSYLNYANFLERLIPWLAWRNHGR